jgi:hypothetical protein
MRPARQVPGATLAFTSSFAALSPYQAPGAERTGLGRRMSSVIDLVAVAGSQPSGITITEAAIALFDVASHAERSAARLCLHKLCDDGRLRKVRGHPLGYGSAPDRFVVVA